MVRLRRDRRRLLLGVALDNIGPGAGARDPGMGPAWSDAHGACPAIRARGATDTMVTDVPLLPRPGKIRGTAVPEGHNTVFAIYG
jgi:hypothetical protein